MFVITKESELHHSIGSSIDGAHPGPKTDRDSAVPHSVQNYNVTLCSNIYLINYKYIIANTYIYIRICYNIFIIY